MNSTGELKAEEAYQLPVHLSSAALKVTSPELLSFRVNLTQVSGIEHLLTMWWHLTSDPAAQSPRRHAGWQGMEEGMLGYASPYCIPPRKRVTIPSFCCKKLKTDGQKLSRIYFCFSSSYYYNNKPELGSLGLDSVQFLFPFVHP